ncbi:MAG: copper amine oxidase protein [Bacilli bacterium]|nr:copper amine oxidase protein [Bacilli bacterium]
MLKKPFLVLLSSIIVSILFTTNVFAASQQEKGFNEHKSTEAAKETKHETKHETNGKGLHDSERGSVTSVTYDTYAGHKGYIGLLKAYENVKDKPAGQIIAALLLKKYGIETVTSVTYNTYGQVQNNAAVLSDFAADLEASGEVELAVDSQKEAIKSDVKNLELYKKLGELNAKLDKTGVKAYVNGEEPKFDDLQPFIKDGSTLVPFRAISDALKAEVLWNDIEKSVTVTKDGVVVKLVIGSDKALVNGKEVTLDVPAEIYNGRTVVPIRFISEALKTTVKFEPESQTVVIYDENQ